jgi:iron(III) transport system ATP-binding protein
LYERPASAFVAGFMGEAMLFDGHSLTDGSVRVGPLSFVPRNPLAKGAAKIAIRPEAWRIVAPGCSPLGGPLIKQAYLGSFQELTIDTVLGPVFVISPQVERQWVLGEELGLALGEHGVTVVSV